MAVKRRKSRRKPQPKKVGVWVLGIAGGNELMKWGKDGDCKYPYATDKEATDQATYLLSTETHAEDVFYIAHVFDNGQMKTFSFDDNDVTAIATHGHRAFVTDKGN